MPRFQDEHIAALKKAMLPRLADGCYFTPEDIAAVQAETGLNKEQIEQWAWHMRFRLPRVEDREAFLRSNGEPEKQFTFPKSKGNGEFAITYLRASHYKEAESGEFFFEFEDKVWEHKLIQRFNELGAGQVNVITFPNNDHNESAANALVRLHARPDDVTYERGTCPPALHAKLQAKLAEEEERKKKAAAAHEFDEKTREALKQSLVDLGGKLDGVHEQVGTVREGVCAIIPDYQREIEELKVQLTHKTKECDRIEAQKGWVTREINELKLKVTVLELQSKRLQDKNAELEETNTQYEEERRSLIHQNYVLSHQLNASNLVANAAALVRETKEIKDHLERDLKRHRAE